MFGVGLVAALLVASVPGVTIEDMLRLDSLRNAGLPRPLWRTSGPAHLASNRSAVLPGIAGAGFGDRVCNDDNSGGCSQRSPEVAGFAHGGFVVAWYEFRDGDADIWFQRFDAAGNPLGGNERANDDVSMGWQGDPSVAVAPDGGFLLAWEDRRDIGNSDLFGQRFDAAGARQGGNFRVSDSAAAGDQCVSGAHTGPDGTTLVAWDDRRNGITGDIYAQFLDSTGLPRGVNFRVNDDAVGWANQYEPEVGGDDSGRFVVVWMDGRGNNASDWNVFAQRFDRAGARIGSNVQVTTDDSIQWSPSVGVSPAGGFAIAWDDRRRSQWDVYAQFYGRNGQPIGGNFRVNGDASAADQTSSSVAGNQFGEFMIVWSDRRNGHGDIYAQRFDSAGSRLGPELRLNDDAGIADQSGPGVTALPEGGYVVVWADSRNGEADIYGQRLGRDGAMIGPNFCVNDDRASSHQRVSSIAMDRTGVICIAWEDERSGETDIYRVVLDTSGRMPGPNLRLNDDPGRASQFYTAVAGGSGRFLAVWNDNRQGGYDIYGQFMDGSGNPLGGNFRVNSDTSAFQWYPYAAMDSSNRATVVWMDTREGAGFLLYGRRFNADGNPAGPEFRIGDVASEQAYASVAMNNPGRAVAAWMDNREGGRHQIYCQLFGPDGAPVGSNFRVNTDSGNAYHGYPACAIADNGQFVVSWEDTRNGGYDVYMQWFDSTGAPLDSNLRVNDDQGETDCYSPTCAFDPTGRLVIAFNDEREAPGNPQILCQRFRPDRTRIGANQRVNEPNRFANNHHWTVGQSVAASSQILAFAWTDNRRHCGWDIFARVADWDLADVEDGGCSPGLPTAGWPAVVARARVLRLPGSTAGETRLLDACGRIVQRGQRDAEGIFMDLAHLSPGVYYVLSRPAAGAGVKLIVK